MASDPIEIDQIAVGDLGRAIGRLSFGSLATIIGLLASIVSGTLLVSRYALAADSEGTATLVATQPFVVLCRRHHRAVHEGRFRIVQRTDGTPAFYRPDGTRVEIAPLMPRWDHVDPDPLAPTTARLTISVAVDADIPATHGDDARFDVGWAIDILRDSAFTNSAFAPQS